MDILLIALRFTADILIIALLIYRLMMFGRDPRIVGVVLFFSSIFLLNVFARWFGLPAVGWVSQKFSEYSILAMIILFQPELRRAILGMRFEFLKRKVKRKVIEEIVKAVGKLARTKTGAIIVLEGIVDIEPIVKGGWQINAPVSADLIEAFFNKSSPTHDGALVIKGDRIVMVGVILPISEIQLPLTFGMRHRSAVGITEESDALAIVVSEETGKISVAYKGELKPDISENELEKMLQKFFKVQK